MLPQEKRQLKAQRQHLVPLLASQRLQNRHPLREQTHHSPKVPMRLHKQPASQRRPALFQIPQREDVKNDQRCLLLQVVVPFQDDKYLHLACLFMICIVLYMYNDFPGFVRKLICQFRWRIDLLRFIS